MFHPAGIPLGCFRVDPCAHEPLCKKLMALIDFLRNLSTYVRQEKEPVRVYCQKSSIPKDPYRMADAGLGISHVLGEINGADHAMLLLEHQDRLQVILARCAQFHRRV